MPRHIPPRPAVPHPVVDLHRGPFSAAGSEKGLRKHQRSLPFLHHPTQAFAVKRRSNGGLPPRPGHGHHIWSKGVDVVLDRLHAGRGHVGGAKQPELVGHVDVRRITHRPHLEKIWRAPVIAEMASSAERFLIDKAGEGMTTGQGPVATACPSGSGSPGCVRWRSGWRVRAERMTPQRGP